MISAAQRGIGELRPNIGSLAGFFFIHLLSAHHTTLHQIELNTLTTEPHNLWIHYLQVQILKTYRPGTKPGNSNLELKYLQVDCRNIFSFQHGNGISVGEKGKPEHLCKCMKKVTSGDERNK
ncbi:hypothetical protein V6N12_029178 [Hibiscus sabdariffa]|uniref:Uncharacterized protein n=1 Tax=Hibiscus sabdariffa TaxID=183260 RepID=A0ABR2CVF2_9ROSI